MAIGNDKTVWSNIGASNHTDKEREKYDYYATDPSAITLLHKHGLLLKSPIYWESSCGGGNLSNELIRLGYKVLSSDKYDHGYGTVGLDFFDTTGYFDGCIITNPPYNVINEYITHALNICTNKIYIFCRIQTIETINRYDKIFRDNPPSWICPFVKRIPCYRSSEESPKGSAVCYAWFIWDKKDSSGDTRVKWLI